MRRLLTAAAVALVIAGGIVAQKQMNIGINLCSQLDPGGWLYELMGCGDPAAGGGGSGAGMD